MPRETQKEINNMFQYVFDKAAESGRNDVLRAKEALRKTKIEDALRDQIRPLNIPNQEKLRLARLVSSEKYDEAQKEIDKHKNKPKEPIKLSKIPKVPKVPSKKLLKDVPEYNHNIPSKMIKSDKVIKELDELMKDIDQIIAKHNKPKSKSKSTKPKLMTKKAENDIIKMVNKEIREVKKIVKEQNIKPKSKSKGRPKLTEEEKLARREARKEATRLRNIEKKANEKRIKAEAKAKLEEHKKAAEEEKQRIARANLRKSKEIDELKSDFTMFRRYVRYLPSPDDIKHLSGKELQSAKDYLDDAEQYYKNAVDTYKKYKKEGLIDKSELDKLVELFEVKHYLEVMNNVKAQFM